MKHYPHHIGDFNNATRHLTRLERSVYRDMLDLYYDTEQPLTLDLADLCRKLIARSNEESTAVEQVLNEFFTETPDGWFHERCDAEIAAYRANNSQRALAGKASAEAKRLRKEQALNGRSTPVESPSPSAPTEGQRNSTNQNQSTNQPVTKEKEAPRKRSAVVVEKPMATVDELLKAGLSFEVATEFIAHKAQAKAPLTDRAWRDHLAESAKAGWTPLQAAEKVLAKNWKGFEAKYVAGEPNPGRPAQPAMSYRERDELAARERAEEFTGRSTSRVIDVAATEIPQPLLERQP